MARRVVLVAWLFGLLPGVISGQNPDLIGVLRESDGVALVLLEHTSDGWVEARSPTDSATSAGAGYFGVREVFVRDSAAQARLLPVSGVVRDWEFSVQWWGYQTEASSAMRAEGASYVVTDTVSDTPFLAAVGASAPDPSRLLALFDSVAPAEDSASVVLWNHAAWRGTLGSDTLTFFTATRTSRASPFCDVLHGIARAGSPPFLRWYGSTDCEKTGRPVPQALLRRGGELSILVRVDEWEGWALEVWEESPDDEWVVAARMY